MPASPGQIALIDAALKQDWKTVLRMLDSGVLVEAADETGVTPLMAAAMEGNIDMLRNLLARGARMDFTDFSGLSALHYAIKAGKLDAVQLLLPLVSNLETISTAGNDVLTMALKTGDMKIFQALLERFPATLEWTPNTRGALEAALRERNKRTSSASLEQASRTPYPRRWHRSIDRVRHRQ